jgi:hypothetical protein
MLLRDISLFLNLEEYGGKYSSDFQFRSRYLCNFVRRRVTPLRFKADGFGSIVVEGCREPVETCPIKGENVASATVEFNKQRYDTLKPTECHEFFIGMLLKGLEKCARHHRIPLSEIKAAIDEFRTDGYRNEWTFKKKTLRPVGLQASLNCSLDMEKFILTLKLERKGVVVYDAPILETKPDETIFAYRFKDVVLDGQAVVVKNKFDKPTFSLDIRSLE